MSYPLPRQAKSLRAKSVANRYRFIVSFLAALGLSFLLSLLSVSAGLAVLPSEIPDPRSLGGGWVADTAEPISPESETVLNQMISELEAKNGSEIMVVTVSETQPSPSPKTFATELFNDWGIGKAGANNGVLFLVSTGDRRAEIEVGYGLEDIISKAQAERLLQEDVLPQFKQEQFEAGILQGTERLVAVVGEEAIAPIISPPRVKRESGESSTLFLSILVVAGACIRGVYDAIKNSLNGNNYHNQYDDDYDSRRRRNRRSSHSSSHRSRSSRSRNTRSSSRSSRKGGGRSGGGGGGSSW